MKTQNSLLLVGVTAAILAAPTAMAQIKPSAESLNDLYPGKAYSPYAERSFPDRVFWGDTHLHRCLYIEAGMLGARLGI